MYPIYPNKTHNLSLFPRVYNSVASQNSLLQLSPLEQQRMSAYKQQQQKILAGVSSYRMMVIVDY